MATTADNKLGDDWSSILKNGGRPEDLLADVDAVNIVSNHLTGVGFLSDAMRDYYNVTKNNDVRFKTFIKNIGITTYGFEKEV